MANGYLGTGINQIFYDYNGHTFWLSGGVDKLLLGNRGWVPEWINVALGFTTQGKVNFYPLYY
jgi:hypothetical protein